MSNDKTPLPLSPDTINAIVTTLGAVVFATTRRLQPTDQAAFANDLARLARNEETRGSVEAQALLLDLHRAALAAAG